ncbi:hypothetical protein SAMN05421770_101854 [Granulicella rosea]|uniref:Metal-dependent hydrolase, beta-lactamase superfamily II n=1 Tax=Granulicella rosea TaxID=474952 RepID=A0A239EAN0_9BACT|nr:hypothetical protein [Granulicella rosea]SNS40962.1 hypothetical protein SAMN05421770_101854 [Granulicella rosea]
MSTLFELTLHAAGDGDCLVLRWGDAEKPRSLLVDLGREACYQSIRPQLERLGDIELFVMSHLDADHIAGAMPMVRAQSAPFRPRRVWFNAGRQLEGAKARIDGVESFSVLQALNLQRGIEHFGWSWNEGFEDRIVSTESVNPGLAIELPEGLMLHLLSPTDLQLAKLLPTWQREAAKLDRSESVSAAEGFETFGLLHVEELASKPYQADTSAPNGTSIAFIAEFEDRRVLLAADAHSEVLERSLRRLGATPDSPYRIDLWKMGHHGSKANTSPGLLKLIDCQRFAISTNGERHSHPNPETIARVLTASTREKIFYFNYGQPQTNAWNQSPLTQRWNYRCVYPREQTQEGTLVIPV